MEVLIVLTNEERKYLLSKRGFKTRQVQFTCSKCHESSITLLKRLSEDFLCRKCKIAITKKLVDEKTKKDINEKRKQTSLHKYGVENVAQLKDVMDKARSTMKEKYGVENARYLQLDENYTSSKKEKVVEKTYTEEEIQSHFEEIENYKTKWGTWTEEDKNRILEKRKETNRLKYGVDFAQQADPVKQRYKLNSFKKWGVENPQQSNIVRARVEKTFKEKYGSNHPNFAYSYEDQLFDSSWELAVWIWAKDNNKVIEREPIKLTYMHENKEHSYYPDFRIEGQLVEVKGPQFFKEGKMVNPFNHSLDDLFESKHQCGLKNHVQFWSTKEMKPILDYVKEKYTKDYIPLFQISLQFPYPQLTTKTDFNIIRYFHKSLYEARRGNSLSPLQAWGDKNLVKKSALNRLKYVGKCTPWDIIQGFNVAKIAPKVSVFKPALAEELIKKYLSDSDIVYDPFSGFSGRMLGTVNCGKRYVGFDINRDHVKESNDIINYKNIGSECSVEVMDLLTTPLKDYTHLKGTCLFTCPPYGGKEHWNVNNDEVEKSCDEWIDLCLEKYKVGKYLFVVDKTEKYKDKIVEEIENKSHFGKNKELVILIESK